MQPSLKHFMSGILDYAGRFPPASLPLDTALSRYQTYQQTDERWILGKFVIPDTELASIKTSDNISFSVILSEPDSDAPSDSIRSFASHIVSFETRLPADSSTIDHISSFLDITIKKIESSGIENTTLFVESTLPDLIDADILAINKFRRNTGHTIGYKLRCGGAQPAVVPDPKQVCTAIRSCINNDLPLKFTAGLHHPFRNYSDTLGVMQYGFINMFAAALLGFGGLLTDADLKICLMDQKESNFKFNDTGLSWNDHTLDAEGIQQLRHEKVISFGSCSFEEPVNGLKQIGLLPVNEE